MDPDKLIKIVGEIKIYWVTPFGEIIYEKYII